MNSEKLIQLIYDDLQVLKGQQEITNTRLDGMDERLNGMDKRLGSLEAKVNENTEGIGRINLCLENEIRPSIMRIAEGHLDLSRKLDEALKIDQEKEKLTIRMNFLEGKVERLDKKVSGLLQA